MDVYQLSSAVDWIPLILTKIKSCCLEVVEFTILLSRLDQLDSIDFPIDWESYDNLFACGIGFKQLRRLSFLTHVSEVEDEVVRKEMKKRLPLCDSRGILHIGPLT